MTRGAEPSPSTTQQSRKEEEEAQRSAQAPVGQSATAPDGDASRSGEGTGNGDTDDELARCPICQFIEAGECKEQHQSWTACRKEAKAAGKDYIDECQDHFKAFLQCAIEHRDYYEPFLEMLGGLSEEEGAGQGAGEGAGAAPEQQQQEQQAQAPSGAGR